MTSYLCIYCGKSGTGASPAHIIPYALGGSFSSSKTVCDQCNNLVNAHVERPALPLFSFFNSYFNIHGRHGISPVPAEVTLDGHEFTTYLDNHGLPVRPLVRKVTDPQGEAFLIFGYSISEIEAKRNQLHESLPELKWEPLQEAHVPGSILLPEPAALELRRLAAKVAFEHFADRIGSGTDLALGADFERIRHFILTGYEPEPSCVVISDRNLTYGFLDFPVPSHAVLLLGHPSNTLLGCFVVFYGLYHYGVLLSRKFPSVGAVDDLLFGYPDIREYHRPRLRKVPFSVAFPWDLLAESYLRDPVSASQAADVTAREKFSQATLSPG